MSLLPRAGARVTLRAMTLEDIAAYRAWMRPDAAWKALDGPYYPLPSAEALDAERARLEAWASAGHQPDPLRRVTIAARDTGGFLGTVTRYWISEETRWPALGLSLYDPATWGGGFGTEALALFIDLVFEAHPEIVRVDLRTWSGNLGMMRVAERLGFQREACFRRARIVDGLYYDGLGYGLLREEWRR